MKTIRDIFIIIGLLVLTGIAIIVSWFEDRIKSMIALSKELQKEDYLACAHGMTGNSISMFFKSCDDCRGKLQENGYSVERMDEFIEEYKKECRTRYLTTYHDVVKRVTE